MQTTNEKIKQIQDDMRSGVIIAPQDIARNHSICAGEYCFCCAEMAELEIIKNTEIEANRHTNDCKSDAQAERQFFQGELGEQYIRLKYKLKALERLLSSLKLAVENAKREWGNNKEF